MKEKLSSQEQTRRGQEAKRKKDGRESVERDPRSGRPAASRTPENAERVRAAISKGRRLTVRDLEAELGTPDTTVSEISTQDPGLKRVTAKFTAWLLLAEQKERRAVVAEGWIQTAANEPDSLQKGVTLKGTAVPLSCARRSCVPCLLQRAPVSHGVRLALPGQTVCVCLCLFDYFLPALS